VTVLSRLAQRWLRVAPAIDRDIGVERDVRVPVGDGVDLLADVYHPAGSTPGPTVLARSPYGRRGPLGFFFGRIFAERGYHSVVQSCRGTFGSGGDWVPNVHERADGLATVAWIEAQPWFDGHLAMQGPSYLGGVQWAIADTAGPSLQVLCTHVAYSNISRHWFGGGSFALGDAIEWTTMVDQQERPALARLASSLVRPRRRRIEAHSPASRRPAARDRTLMTLPLLSLDERVAGTRVAAWRDIVEHPGVDNPRWAGVDHRGRVAATRAAVLQVGGWYDIFLPQQVDDYAALVASGHRPRLVIGPWTHTAPRGFSTQVRETLRFLDAHLGDDRADDEARPPVRVFVMGAGEWRDLATWPPPDAREQRWHLHPDGRLAPEAPPAGDPDSYTYDPADPTPIVGGTLLSRSGGRRDQARTERRSDVVCFTSEPLTRALDVLGPVTAAVHVGSDLDRFDVFVRLCDVDRRGRSYNVCDGLVRVTPDDQPRPADGVWCVEVPLWPTAQRFLAGHRLRLQVSSGAHPRFARNLGTDEPLATGTSLRVAHQAIHHEPAKPSALLLAVLPAR
jgi:putative CocE/NonD family hydrolase